jgi:hypothetical protein
VCYVRFLRDGGGGSLGGRLIIVEVHDFAGPTAFAKIKVGPFGDVNRALVRKQSQHRNTMDKPQIVEHASKALNYTVFNVKWIPRSARLVSLGSHARGTGALEIYSLSKGELSLQTSVHPLGFA